MDKNEEKDNISHIPFGGVLGNAVIIRVLEQLIADPDSSFNLSILSKLSKSSVPQVKEALEQLESVGFVKMISNSQKRPIYIVNKECNRFVALTLFAYSVVDDAFSSNVMKDALRELSPYMPISLVGELMNMTTSPSYAITFSKPIEHHGLGDVDTPLAIVENKEQR